MIAVTLGLGILIIFINLTYSFNRASFVFPAFTMTAVFVARVRRISPAFLLGVARRGRCPCCSRWAPIA